ncbi:TPA: baseplate J/gp47 family protein [Acinetobacter baumannii]|uniref:baseplate J/gp47 family protein n=1 Tax=Acinetobacter calcoaceticus/baumannii complex TaxID=909768 RepID=UPI000BF7DF9C|nr:MULTISPECIES: baseplate J/gp47 family protein [Acinetobacter calcoaceticus/baumannii complex]MDC5350438.1 baseplate J/gp47 family protein [Acinetobacter baumannii]MDE9411913.1 baseplate J/gp47 family protein [Acinetobacter nosocomialis]MDQ9824403.1 baseplate J/gp47 family protein [Acinetobacter sp. 163]SSU98476.1 putative phage Mu protein gp47-like protein [Acinetobacter baumannii]
MALTTVAPVIDESGITAPTYDQVLLYLKDKYRSIYGNDVYLENDSLDGQFLGILSLVISDVNAVCVKTYNSFNPKTANTDALTRNVKINGIARSLATYSTVDVTITGLSGTLIRAGIVADKNNNKWILPLNITIPPSGFITVSATAEKAGAILASANTIKTILTPTRGWQGVNNQNSSSIGQDAETNAKLRQRQALSVAIPSQSMPEGLRGAILDLPNVTRCKYFENKETVSDGNGLPPKSLCVIVYGGDSQAIGNLIQKYKSMGCALYGNTNVTVVNVYGDAETISFYRPDVVNITFKLQITTYESYSADTADSICKLLAEYVNALDIGDKITQNKLYGAANLYGAEQSQTYEVSSIKIVANGAEHLGDYILPFGCVAFCDPALIEIEVTSG